MPMIRTQIYLPEDLYLQAKLMADSQNTTISQLIRDSLKKKTTKKTPKNKPSLLDGFTSHIKKGQKKPPKDLATNIDYYLYVEPYKNL